ncbi:HDOD domain-containing protein [Luteimonas granuli]|uniref:HDOD domain-containing protein n=1 Tax=Luteimonas granuli TaxID=1176533 RepID=A0A518N6N2_9GAMM|nr:HDOD domain-containing protein [Luteimonas granuli]
MTTDMPTLWIPIFAALLVVGTAVWMRHRGRRGRGTVPPESAPGASPTHAVRVEGTDVPSLEPERLILQGLCARAFAGPPAAPAAASTAAQSAAATAAVETLERIHAHPRYTPRRPQLLPQLTRAINDPDASAHSISAIVRQDPALAGNLLRIANSVAYRRQAAPVEHLERAVALLGTEGLRRTVMAALLQPVIPDDGSVFARCATLIWDHTLLSADIAARPVDGAGRDDLHAAQLLALLHGLGSVVVLQVLRDSWKKSGEGDPDPGTLVSLLDTWSVPCARAISVDWGVSERLRHALEELADGTDGESPGSLGRSLRISRTEAAAAMMVLEITDVPTACDMTNGTG